MHRRLTRREFWMKSGQNSTNIVGPNRVLLGVLTDRLALDSALIKCSQITSLSTAQKSGLKFIGNWLYGGEDGEGKRFIANSTDVETLTWSEEHKKDFVTIRNESERDIWTSMVVTKSLKVWHGTLGRWKVFSPCAVYEHPTDRLW